MTYSNNSFTIQLVSKKSNIFIKNENQFHIITLGSPTFLLEMKTNFTLLQTTNIFNSCKIKLTIIIIIIIIIYKIHISR